jgi:hypothetical protein
MTSSALAAAEHRLVQGIEVLDAIRGGRIAHPLRVDLEGPFAPSSGERSAYARPAGWRDRAPGVVRHASCLHVLLAHPHLLPLGPGLEEQVTIRIYDHARRFAPRRLRVPLLDPADLEGRPLEHRIRRPRLFPGAAYDTSERVTGLRGRVLRDGAPMPWARVEARHPEDGVVIGHAHGDDRGEFLLLIGAHPILFNDLKDSFPLSLTVYGPGAAPPPGHGFLHGLPEEVLPAPGDPDLVCPGKHVPSGYEPAPAQLVTARLGRIASLATDLTFA